MAKKKATTHPGFDRVSAGIAASEGISQARADAILAASARRASKGAVAVNPRLARVSGVKKPAKK